MILTVRLWFSSPYLGLDIIIDHWKERGVSNATGRELFNRGHFQRNTGLAIESPGSNPPLLQFRNVGIFALCTDSPVHSAINEYLAIDSGGTVSEKSLRVIAAWLELFTILLFSDPSCVN